jgi:hypothetical protein
VLVPESDASGATVGLCLYESLDHPAALREWRIDSDRRYRATLAAIIADHAIDRVIVSSLIGHTLDALRTGVATVLVCHDYHALGLAGLPAEVDLVAPSDSVRRNAPPGLRERIRVIPHGTALEIRPVEHTVGDGLRIVVLGRLTEAKGLRLLEAVAGPLREIADVTLLGCGAESLGFNHVADYRHSELPALLERQRPHLGLLLSTVPETFSYTLSELFAAAIPPLATRIGAFEDRIEHGVTGLLCDPAPEAILAAIRGTPREHLRAISDRLRAWSSRSVEAMIADYGILPPSPPPPVPMSRVRLYWRSADGDFGAASRSEALIPFDTAWHSARLPIPPGDHARLRLDPGSEPGPVALRAMVLRDSAGQAVWEWDGGPGLFDFVVRSGVVDLGGSLYLADHTPHFTLGAPADAVARLAGGGTLEFEIAHPDTAEVLDGLISRQQAEWEGFKNTVAACQADVAAHRAHAEACQAEIAATRDRAAIEIAQAREVAGAQVARAEAETRAMRESLSWRLTEPLRRIARRRD